MPPATDPPFLIAHQTKISGDVGGTHHIEPNDTPRAGETVTAWFALQQRGGNAIELGNCDCSVAVYAEPVQAGDEAIATPPLSAIDVEGQRNVPAADIVFPDVGAYELVISGSPLGDMDFSPFELRFPITVAAGKAVQQEVAAPAQAVNPGSNQSLNQGESSSVDPSSDVVLAPTDVQFPGLGGWVGIGLVGLISIGALALVLGRRKSR